MIGWIHSPENIYEHSPLQSLFQNGFKFCPCFMSRWSLKEHAVRAKATQCIVLLFAEKGAKNLKHTFSTGHENSSFRKCEIQVSTSLYVISLLRSLFQCTVTLDYRCRKLQMCVRFFNCAGHPQFHTVNDGKKLKRADLEKPDKTFVLHFCLTTVTGGKLQIILPQLSIQIHHREPY